jgi:hypothetical protein
MRKFLAAVVVAVLGSVVVQAVGADPAAAIPGQRIEWTLSPVQSAGGWTQDAVCPDGYAVTGGGALIDNGIRDNVYLGASYPLNDGRTWRVRAVQERSIAPWTVKAYAICAPGVYGWELKWGNSGPGTAVYKTTYTFECSKGKKVLSAGGKVDDAPDGTVGLTMIRPDGPLTIGRASARVGHVVYNGSWSVDSYAICAFPPPGLQNWSQITQSWDGEMTCPGGSELAGVGGGGGLIDLGRYFLVSLYPKVGQVRVGIHMTGVPGDPLEPGSGGMLTEMTCANN